MDFSLFKRLFGIPFLFDGDIAVTHGSRGALQAIRAEALEHEWVQCHLTDLFLFH
ncbi:MAG: hypothetical protein KC592_05565 [Nitrospira sp.]|nr:hypothetical protein [Nitrospira sp.]